MTTIRLNNKHREKILDEWSKIMLQTKTPMRKKLDEAVSNFLGARTKAYQVAINIVYDRISTSDIETFKKFEQLEYHQTSIDACTTFNISQEEDVYGAMSGEAKKKKPPKFLKMQAPKYNLNWPKKRPRASERRLKWEM